MTINQISELVKTVAPQEAQRLYQAAQEDRMSLKEVLHAAVYDYLEFRRVERTPFEI
jgi:dihydrodipicolinate synthase/N-acetylneuraminate lyase